MTSLTELPEIAPDGTTPDLTAALARYIGFGRIGWVHLVNPQQAVRVGKHLTRVELAEPGSDDDQPKGGFDWPDPVYCGAEA